MRDLSLNKIGFFGLLFLIISCAKPPTQELSDAQNAVNAAIQAGAEEYASEALSLAQDALGDTNAKMEGKDYKEARIAALDAKTKADEATALVEVNKAEAKLKAEGEMADVKSTVEALTQQVSKIKGKAAEEIKSDLASITADWTAGQEDYTAEHYGAALVKWGQVREKAAALQIKTAQAEKAPAVMKKPAKKKRK